MRILYVITELHEGGAENALGEVASRLAAQGHDVSVAALFGGSGAVALRLGASGVPVTDLGVTRPWQVGRVHRLRATVREFRPDVVQAWLFHAGMAARLSVPRSIPLVCSLRVVEPRAGHVWLERLTRGLVGHYVCVSPAVAEFARSRLRVDPSRVSVIENGVRIPSESAHARSYEVLRGLTVGRITPQKGIDVLLRMLSMLPREEPWEWSIAGACPDAEYGQAMESLGEELGVAERVRWLGSVPRAAMDRLYREANVLVLSSRWEGQPNVVLEAMAYGLPVVATRVDGVLDLDREVPGVVRLAQTDDPADLAAAVEETRRSPDLRERLLALSGPLVRRRDWAVACEQHLRLYRDVLAARERSSGEAG